MNEQRSKSEPEPTTLPIETGIRLFKSKKRLALLPKGHRLYSSPEIVSWICGKRYAKFWDWEHEDQSHLPEMPAHFHNLDLGGEWKNWRYMSLTARWHYLQTIIRTFDDIVSGRVVPIRFQRQPGTPYIQENDFPPDGWRERAEAIWAKLPANDSDIFDRPAASENPKHTHMAEQLASLLDWRRMGKPIQPISTNWQQADNDNYTEEQADSRPAIDAERRYRAGPKPETLIKMAGPVTVRKHAHLGGGGSWELTPTDPLYPARAGKLNFSNGKDNEWDKQPPRGAILNYEDEFTELLGPEPDAEEQARRVSYWHSLMSYDADAMACRLLAPIRHIKTGRMRRKVKMTQAQQLEILATHQHPPITYCRPGLPCGHEDIGAPFLGGWISASKGKQPLERWEDISDEISRQAEFERWATALSSEEQKALNLACTAANFREIGEEFGKTGKNAERYGKKVLLASNENLKKTIAA